MQNFRIGRLALVTAITGLVGFICLIVMWIFQYFKLQPNPFGTINDVANAVLALLSVVLAGYFYSHLRLQLGWLHALLLVLAFVGGLVAVWGSILIISGRTGYILAGLYSAAGFG